MEKICPQCRASNPADGSFCRACATPIALVQPTYPQTPYQQWQQEPQNQWQQPQDQWQQPHQWQDPAPNQQWQQTPFGGPLAAPQTAAFQPPPSNRPVIALCLVIAGFLCCGPILTIPGAILGWMEMSAIKQGKSSESGLAMAQIAFWGGIALTILTTIGLVFGIVFGVLDAMVNG